MTKKTKNILWIVGVCLVICGAVVLGVYDVAGGSEDVEPVDSTAVDSVAIPEIDTLAIIESADSMAL